MKLFNRLPPKSGWSVGLAILSSTLLLSPYFISENPSQTVNSSKYNHLKKSKFIRDDVKIDFISPACESYKQIKDITDLKIKISKSRKWAKNIIQAYSSTSLTIPEVNRDRFKGKLSINNSQCHMIASVRISGDWKDHLA